MAAPAKKPQAARTAAENKAAPSAAEREQMRKQREEQLIDAGTKKGAAQFPGMKKGGTVKAKSKR